MIAQQELLKLLNLPLAERLQIAQRLIESAVEETQPTSESEPATHELSPTAKRLLSLAGPQPIKSENSINGPADNEKIPFLSLVGIFSGGPGDTGERADEICRDEIKKRSGFTLKEELPE